MAIVVYRGVLWESPGTYLRIGVLAGFSGNGSSVHVDRAVFTLGPVRALTYCERVIQRGSHLVCD